MNRRSFLLGAATVLAAPATPAATVVPYNAARVSFVATGMQAMTAQMWVAAESTRNLRRILEKLAIETEKMNELGLYQPVLEPRP